MIRAATDETPRLNRPRTGSRSGWKDLRPAAILLLVSLVGAFVAGSLPRAGATRFAVVAPPWYGLAETAALVGEAGGDIVDAGGLPNVIIAYSANPGFIHALYRHGAWLVMDSRILGGCLGIIRQISPSPVPSAKADT